MTMTPSAADPIAILVAEHLTAMTLFGELDAALTRVEAADSEARERAMALAVRTLVFLNTELEVHIRKEEEPLFSRLKAALPSDDRLVDEMIAEHDQIRMKREQVRGVLDEMLSGDDHVTFREQRARLGTTIEAVERTAAGSEAWRALRRTWRAAYETLRVHFQNEEEIAFPLAQALLDVEELAAAGREMAAIDKEQHMDTPVQLTGIAQTTDELLGSEALARDGRTARTLVKSGPLRIVLVAIGAGGDVQEHQAAGPTTIQAVRGRVTIAGGGVDHALQQGDVLTLPAAMPHALRAEEPSAVLVTIVMGGDG
ncbi:MAG: hemerythrin domain-containing protein [Dehalococcoidia bacterium]